MDNMKICDIDSLIKIIEEHKKDNENCELYFRGQSQHYEKVEPSIARNGYLESEDILFKEYILRNPDEFVGEKTTFEKLVKMQHYKLPTRLLDITSNPLIALYFAVEKDEDKDGELIIYCVPHQNIKYYDSDTVSAVSNIAKRAKDKLNIESISRDKGEKESDWIPRFNKETDVQYLLHEIKEEKPYFKDCIKKEHLESIWCVKPLLKNRRIIKQDGSFLLFGINGTKEKVAQYKSDVFEPIRVSVAVKSKKTLKKNLELLGISKDKIYPELDTTAEYLSEKYKKA